MFVGCQQMTLTVALCKVFCRLVAFPEWAIFVMAPLEETVRRFGSVFSGGLLDRLVSLGMEKEVNVG